MERRDPSPAGSLVLGCYLDRRAGRGQERRIRRQPIHRATNTTKGRYGRRLLDWKRGWARRRCRGYPAPYTTMRRANDRVYVNTLILEDRGAPTLAASQVNAEETVSYSITPGSTVGLKLMSMGGDIAGNAGEKVASPGS